MVLEDRGVTKKAFMDLQRDAIAEIHMSSDSIMQCRTLFRAHSLGSAFRLSYICQFLHAIGMGMPHEQYTDVVLRDPFFERLVQFGKNDVLRSIKHNARIPVKQSWLLVGVADEGFAYEAEGCENVFKLEEGQIFGVCILRKSHDYELTPLTACVQESADEDPKYIEGEMLG